MNHDHFTIHPYLTLCVTHPTILHSPLSLLTLLCSCATLAPTSQYKNTALMWAAVGGIDMTVELLIKAGSDVTATDKVSGREGVGGWA